MIMYPTSLTEAEYVNSIFKAVRSAKNWLPDKASLLGASLTHDRIMSTLG